MHVKSNASSSPTAHVGGSAPTGPAKAAKSGAPDFTKMLSEAKAGAPASAATTPMAAGPAAANASGAATATPATLSLDTASLAARG